MEYCGVADFGGSCKLLISWSGRRDSNPRRPAWEKGRRLTIKMIAFLFLIWRYKTAQFLKWISYRAE